jgi:hypothetical protein
VLKDSGNKNVVIVERKGTFRQWLLKFKRFWLALYLILPVKHKPKKPVMRVVKKEKR